MKKRTPIIAPSILSADFAHLGSDIRAVLKAGADVIHIDVMDNHYVPNLTIGPMICKALRKDGITAPFDVHLMVKPVDSLISMFAEAGADYISIHPESTEHLDRSLQLIKTHNCKAGLVFNPATPLNWLDYVIQYLDLILIMTVNPGFGGQEFISEQLPKIEKVRAIIDQQKRPIYLAVDGGVKESNIAQIAQAGADFFVAGSAIFHSKNYQQTIQSFREKIA
ncbi:MAG: ribulose-phosphate 3-epimerase [Gammaproteobacteria bacterium]|nr:ribulose-phosphate 3-epimerase [Gammaproteobacteria bacterium]